jgi:hypothetical protein
VKKEGEDDLYQSRIKDESVISIEYDRSKNSIRESYKKVGERTFVTKLYYNRRHEVRQIPDSPRKLLAFGNLLNTALFDSLKYEEDLHAPARGMISSPMVRDFLNPVIMIL